MLIIFLSNRNKLLRKGKPQEVGILLSSLKIVNNGYVYIMS